VKALYRRKNPVKKVLKLPFDSGYLDLELDEKMNFIYASSLKDAFEKAYEIKGPKAKITVIPDGVAVITKK
jgi:nickel-dependent lactate racemase